MDGGSNEKKGRYFSMLRLSLQAHHFGANPCLLTLVNLGVTKYMGGCTEMPILNPCNAYPVQCNAMKCRELHCDTFFYKGMQGDKNWPLHTFINLD